MPLQLLVGLGNVGKAYEETRHNAGFLWINAAAKKLGATFRSDTRFRGEVSRITVNGAPLYLLKPHTMMNASGQAVAALARFYKIDSADILVVHDELDIAPGQCKLKHGGGHAGHNGLRDIQTQLSSPAYWRLRVGIGHPGVKNEVVSWVLKKPAPTDAEKIYASIERSLQALPLLLEGDMPQAQRKIHTQPTAPEVCKKAAMLDHSTRLQ